jgi:ADP-ribosylglycohydrolase
VNDEAKGCLVGLAVGDALGQPSEGWTPAAVRAEWGYLTGLLSEDAVVSDDTEYALFSALALLKYGAGITSENIASEWLSAIVPQQGPFKGAGFSEMAAIENLRRGARPPYSGRHYHSWSDGLAMRVAPFGVFAAGDPEQAARLARIDGEVSHAGEGILAGQAVAAAIAVAMTRADLDRVARAALAVVPADSWTGRNLRLALEIGGRHESARGAIDDLHDALAVSGYAWMDLAPEAVGLAFGLLRAGRGELSETLLAAVNLGRDADTVAAIAGAVLGAQQGLAAIPTEWRRALGPASGRCLACVAGLELEPTAEALVELRKAGRA